MTTHPRQSVPLIRSAFVGAAVLCIAGATAGAEPISPIPIEYSGNGIESDGGERIAYASILPMLTQRVAAASCAVVSHVEVEESYAVLKEATGQFDQIIAALRHGDMALNILGPEQDRRTLHDIDEIEKVWSSTHKSIDAVLANPDDVEAAHAIDDDNLQLMKLTDVLVSDIAGEYGNPYELTQADLLMLKIIARERTLTQQIAKDACEIWSDYHADEGRADLQHVTQIFETSLIALRDGMPEVGLKPAPTEEIRADLDELMTRWVVIRGNLDRLVAGETLAMEDKFEIYHDLNEELASLDKLVGHYLEYSERHH